MPDQRTDERYGVFDAHFYSKRHHIAWRAPVVVDALLQIVQPSTVLDVGCSIGEFVKEFNDRGIDAKGIDLNDPGEYLLCHRGRFIPGDVIGITSADEEMRVAMEGKIDLVMCLMTIQFIDKTKWSDLAAEFGRLTAPGGSVLTVTDAMGFHNVLIRKAPLAYNAKATRQFRELLAPYEKKTAIRAILNCARFYNKIGE